VIGFTICARTSFGTLGSAQLRLGILRIVAYVACAYLADVPSRNTSTIPSAVRAKTFPKTFQWAIVVGLLLSAQPAFADELNSTGVNSPGLLRTSVMVIRNFVEKITRPIFRTVSGGEREERLPRGMFSIDQFQADTDPMRDAWLLFVNERRVEWPMTHQAKMAWELKRYNSIRDNGTEIGVSWSVNFKF
jgi:hypothetical protein